MSAASERVTPSTSADRVPTGLSNNHLLPPEACHTRPPPDKNTTLPSHRHKCIKCGCPSLCCTQAGFLLWVLFLILIQVGPIAVLYMDHHFSHKYGSTLSRYQTEEGMEPVLCRTVGIYLVNVTGKCQNNLLNQPCLQIRVIVYPSDKIRPIVNATFLVRSEREHVLKKSRNCFNLDICQIDKKDSWSKYRRKMEEYRTLLDAKQKQKQSFICYYKIHRGDNYREYPLVLLEMNTSLCDFLFWFVLPILCLCCCWLCIVFLCYWFCYPCDKEARGLKEYHEINAIHADRSDYSINSPTGMAAAYSGSGGTDGGGWPTKGPSDNDTSAWPLYWR